MRSGKSTSQYVVDFSFKGEKDITYQSIEKEIRPILRERQLTELLEN